jgi:hypothetical protein
MAFNPIIPERIARVTITVTRKDSTGTAKTLQYSFQQNRMRISVRQGGNQFGNAKVEIFGMKLDDMNQIARLWRESMSPTNLDMLSIDVWDGDNFISFFTGVITWSAVDASGMPQVKLVVEANAGMALMNMTASPYTNAGPVKMSDALKAIALLGQFTVTYDAAAVDPLLTDVHVEGAPMDQIRVLMNHFSKDLTWFTSLNVVVVRATNAPLGGDPITISKDNGLVGYPVYSTSGLQFQTLFNPQIVPGRALNVVSNFDFIQRTKWVASVLAHALDANLPGGQWLTGVAANSFGTIGNNQS